MAFINEVISEADKARIDWRKFKYWPGDRHGLRNPDCWTIDRERDVFFVRLTVGRTDGPPPTYGMSWKGAFIRVVAGAQSDQKRIGIWELMQVDIPQELESKRTELLDVLEQAIRAYGWNYQGTPIKAITYAQGVRHGA